MTRIGAVHSKGPLVAIQGHRVVFTVVKPESLVYEIPQLLRLLLCLSCKMVFVQQPQELRNSEKCANGISLYFNQCNGRLGDSAIAVTVRVARILPPLIKESLRITSAVLDQPVAVQVTVIQDPFRCGLEWLRQLME